MRVFAWLAIALPLLAQAPSNIAFQCSEEDLQVANQNCTAAEPCLVYVELSAIEVVGPKLFLTGNLHTDSATLFSILLTSDDGGRTWTEPHERIRTALLDQIQFFDFEVGWVAGQIIMARPKDPFLLVTQDGGKSWRSVPVFEDGKLGSIDQVWFDSRTTGSMVVDRGQTGGEAGARYELYETMTGGTSWSLREATSTPIKLKKLRSAANADWRLRADAPSKTYRIERLQAGKWVGVATFPVRVAECKFAEPSLAEPPPTEEDKPGAEPAKDGKAPSPAAPKSPRRPPSLKKKPPA